VILHRCRIARGVREYLAIGRDHGDACFEALSKLRDYGLQVGRVSERHANRVGLVREGGGEVIEEGRGQRSVQGEG
jgi:hypothetical protein